MGRLSGGERVPFFFGTSGRRLFGFYHGPPEGNTAALAVLVCPPLGREHIDSHRCLQYLAGRLAEGRCAVMRFDYYGTGDSEGAGSDVTLSGLLADTSTALDELCRKAGTQDVMLLGLRTGATVACLLRSDSIDVNLRRLVLWDAFSDTAPGSGQWGSDQTWARGYAYGEPFLRALRECEITLGDLAGTTEAALIIETQDGDMAGRLPQLLKDRGVRAEVAQFLAVPFFSQPGDVPFKVVNTVVDWATG